MTGLESELALFIRWQVGRIPWLHTTINTLINRHSIPIGSSQNAKVIKSFWLLRIHHLVFLRKRNVDPRVRRKSTWLLTPWRLSVEIPLQRARPTIRSLFFSLQVSNMWRKIRSANQFSRSGTCLWSSLQVKGSVDLLGVSIAMENSGCRQEGQDYQGSPVCLMCFSAVWLWCLADSGTCTALTHWMYPCC